jgi:hypothetical protein
VEEDKIDSTHFLPDSGVDSSGNTVVALNPSMVLRHHCHCSHIQVVEVVGDHHKSMILRERRSALMVDT